MGGAAGGRRRKFASFDRRPEGKTIQRIVELRRLYEENGLRGFGSLQLERQVQTQETPAPVNTRGQPIPIFRSSIPPRRPVRVFYRAD